MLLLSYRRKPLFSTSSPLFFFMVQNNGGRSLIIICNSLLKLIYFLYFSFFLIFLKIFEVLSNFKERKRACTSPFYVSLTIWAESRDLSKASVFEYRVQHGVKVFCLLVYCFGFNIQSFSPTIVLLLFP